MDKNKKHELPSVNKTPLLIDFFCGAGGTSAGYANAGFAVVGVDTRPQKNYPFPFLQMNAMEAMARLHSGEPLTFNGRKIGLLDAAALAASPPCQNHSKSAKHLSHGKHPDLLAETRSYLDSCQLPYAIENVPGAAFVGTPLFLCGTMFNLRVFRHRYFENNIGIWLPPAPCDHWSKIGQNGFCSVFGNGASNEKGGNRGKWMDAMGIDWMTSREVAQAIPPAYTEYVGKQVLTFLETKT